MIETPQSFVVSQECQKVAWQNGYRRAMGEEVHSQLVRRLAFTDVVNCVGPSDTVTTVVKATETMNEAERC